MDENAEKSNETAVKNDDLITDFGRRTRNDSLSSKNQSDDEQNESIPKETNKDNNTNTEEEGRKTVEVEVEGDDGDDDILLRAQAIAMAVSSSASKLSAEEAKKTLAQKQDSNQKKFLQEIEHKKKKQQQQVQASSTSTPAWLSNVQNFQSMISSSMQTATSPNTGAGTTNTNTTSSNSGKNENSMASITSSSGIFGKQHQFRWPGQSDKSTATATATVPVTVSNVEKETSASTGQQDTSYQPKSTNNVSTEEENNNNKKSRNSSSKNPLNNIKEDSLKSLKDSMNIFKIPKFGEETASASTSVPTKTIHNEKESTKKEDITLSPPTQTSEKVQTKRSISPVPADRLKKTKEISVPSSPSKIPQPSQDSMESTNVVATTTTTNTVINRKSKKTSNSYSCLPSNSALGDVVTSPSDLQQIKSQEMSSSTNDETVILLEDSVWKRRSGLGKLSTHAWEKRKLILQGTKLTYFSLDKEQAQTPVVDKTSSASPTTIEKHEPRPWEPATVPTTTTTTAATKPNKAPSIWEQAAANFEKAQENFNKSINSLNMTLPSSSSISSPFTTNTGSSSSSGNSSSTDPRGSLDIIKEKASVCASSGHSGAPTPFSISIKVGMETKWKLCFESQEEQRKWLDVLGDIVIKNSVDLHHENHWKIKSTTTRKSTFPTGTGSVSSNKDENENEKLSSSSTDGQKLHASTAAEKRGNARGPLVEARGKSRRSLLVLQRGFSQNLIQTDHLEFHLEEDEILAFLTAVNIALIVSKLVGIYSFILLLVSINICLACWCNLVPEDFLQKILSYLTENDNNKKTTKTSSNSEISSRKVKKAKLDKKKKKEVFDKDIAKKKDDEEEEEKRTTIQPKAGSTTYHVSETPTSPDTRAGIPPAWRNISASSLAVRGPGYGSNKIKIPSPGELYECVGVDVIDSSMRVSEIADKVNLSHWFNDDEEKDNAVTNNKPWSAPDIFIVNVAVPTEAPKLTRSETDGQTINVVMYLKMTAQTRKILELSYSSSSSPSLDDDSNNNDELEEEETSKQNNNSLVNGVKLFDQWCKKSPTDPKFQARFKLVPNMLNLVEIGLPSYIAKYNSKPVLIKRNGVTGFLSSHKPSMNKPNENNNNNNNNFTVMEFDISLHPFPYIAKQAFSYLNENYFAKIVANIGVVIEGRAEDELPEVVIGCMQLCYPDTKAAIKDQDWFFSGKGVVEVDLVDSTNCDDDDDETQKKKVIVKQEEVPSLTHA